MYSYQSVLLDNGGNSLDVLKRIYSSHFWFCRGIVESCIIETSSCCLKSNVSWDRGQKLQQLYLHWVSVALSSKKWFWNFFSCFYQKLLTFLYLTEINHNLLILNVFFCYHKRHSFSPFLLILALTRHCACLLLLLQNSLLGFKQPPKLF